MKKTLLVSLAVLTGVFSMASAQSSIPGRIDGDLSFYDKVYVSQGVDYPDNIDGDTGTSSVKLEGEGSLTIGNRLGQGFPRVVIYGGTTVSVEQDFKGRQKNWWAGNLKSPNKVLDIPVSRITWKNSSNHTLGKMNIASSFGFESVSETYKFSPAAYIVLPAEVPNGAKVWYALHSIDPENPNLTKDKLEIGENDFCIIKDNLCVVKVESMNQIVLVEESFESCPRAEVPNGSVGAIPYCVITCNSGYEIDENAISCVAPEKKGEEAVIEEKKEEKKEEPVAQEKVEQKKSVFDGYRPVRMHYTGARANLELIDTSDLSGDALRNALRRNAQINSRIGKGNSEKDKKDGDVSALAKIVNDISSKLWSWENQKSGSKKMVASMDKGEEIVLEGGEKMKKGESESLGTMHSSGYLLPSTGSSTIFIIISILGIGLMMMAFKRR